MKRHSSGETNEESHHQSTKSKKRKTQPAKRRLPPSIYQSLLRKLHLQSMSKSSCTSIENPTTTECGPFQKRTFHEQRIRLLTKMQSSQNQIITDYKTRLHHNSEQLEEAKDRQRDQGKRICELMTLVDHLEHNLMQHVESIESLKKLITKATTRSSSSDDNQNQSRNNIETETGTAQTEQEEDEIYGLPNRIDYLNQTLTGRTIDSFGMRRSFESSGNTADLEDAGGLHEHEALTDQVAAGMSDHETLLGPVITITARSISGREACPYCQKEVSKSYINQHIRLYCTARNPEMRYQLMRVLVCYIGK